MTFPGGELEGTRPKVLCPACRERLRAQSRHAPLSGAGGATLSGSQSGLDGPAPRPTLCFQCYRVDRARDRALEAARSLQTASEARFQSSLPFEPVNRVRLERLRAARAAARAAMSVGSARFVDRRRHAQIAARHALERIAAGLQSRGIEPPEQDRVMASAIHAAELQLPEAWLPFVVSR